MTVSEEQMATLLAEHIRAVSGTDIGLDASFFAAGLNSATLLALHTRLGSLFPGLLISEMFKYPTRRALARFLAGAPASHRTVRPDYPRTSPDSPEARRALRARIRQRDS